MGTILKNSVKIKHNIDPFLDFQEFLFIFNWSNIFSFFISAKKIIQTFFRTKQNAYLKKRLGGYKLKQEW